MIDVYEHKEQRRCNESLRLSRLPATPPPPDPSTTKNSSSSNAPKKSSGTTCRLLKILQSTRGSLKYYPGFRRKTARWAKHRLFILLHAMSEQSSGTQRKVHKYQQNQHNTRPQEPSPPNHVEKPGILPKPIFELTQNMYPLSNQALRDPQKNSNCGISTVFCTCNCNITGMASILSRN